MLASSLADHTQRQKTIHTLAHKASANFGQQTGDIVKSSRRVDLSAEELVKHVRDHYALHTSPQHANFLYQNQHGFNELVKSEEQFLHRLNQYVKRQFKDSFVSLAASDNPGQYELVDVAAAPEQDTRHVVYEADRRELQRLRSLDAMTSENLARARVGRAGRAAALNTLQAVQQQCVTTGMDAMNVLKYVSALIRYLFYF